jgi:hypothetical protein
VNAAGALTAVAGKNVTNTGGTALIGFGIAGVPVAVPVGVTAGRRKMAKPPRRAAGKVKAATKKKPKAAKRAVKAKRRPAPKRAKRIVRKKAKR